MCHYPEDARKSGRPTKAEVQALQAEVATFRQLFKNGDNGQDGSANGSDYRKVNVEPVRNSTSRSGSDTRSLSILDPRTPSLTSQESPLTRDIEVSTGPSPIETQIACAVAEDGTIAVHGATSHMRDPATTAKPGNNDPVSQDDQEEYEQIVRDQLFANAAYQRQRETAMFSNPTRSLGIKVELDGLPMELAVHLLELHFNRQHFAYLLTYRPAIMESLTNDGPYANKLLLNAIYYCSCLYSDRTIFRSNPDDPDTMVRISYGAIKL